MCYPVAPTPPTPEVEVSQKKWSSGLFSHLQMGNALRKLKLNKSIRSNGRRIQKHIRNITEKATKKVERVRRWVFNLTFAKVCVPLLFLGFMLLLHPHKEIQVEAEKLFLQGFAFVT